MTQKFRFSGKAEILHLNARKEGPDDDKQLAVDGATATLHNANGDLLATFGEGADPLYENAKQVVVSHRRASILLVQRELRIGYNRAARLIEQMEADGVVSAMDGSGSRDVLVAAAEAA
ncbi:MAG: DNA translocase FtsK [Herbaspirillum frisingense]|uniref:DNA translocase FtsK n=1 Tax=Herbaspirillum frisingense TaxID=92645 RepID=A0A7V8JS42_9BURK|nr:MAG: DNA translocase FtsK [Herbaspirillum frisingense]